MDVQANVRFNFALNDFVVRVLMLFYSVCGGGGGGTHALLIFCLFLLFVFFSQLVLTWLGLFLLLRACYCISGYRWTNVLWRTSILLWSGSAL